MCSADFSPGAQQSLHETIRNEKAVMTMQCCVCGAELQYSGHGKKPRYCSSSCRVKAKRMRDKIGARPAATKKEKAALAGDHFEYKGRDIPANRRHDVDLAFERKMDEPLETTLRRNRARLQRAIDDPDCPPAALAALSKQLIAVSHELMEVRGSDDVLAILDDDDEVMHDDEFKAETV